MLAASEEVDGDGNDVGDGEEDDAGAAESVESSGGSEVDQAEENLDASAEQHGVERHIKLSVDLAPPAGAWDGTITREGPDTARGSGGASNTTQDGENHDGHTESECTAFISDGRAKDERQWLEVWVGDDIGDGWHDEHKRHQEEDATDPVHEQSSAHGAWHLDSRIASLLAHAQDHTSGRGCIGRMEQTDAEGPAIDPASGGSEVAQSETSIITSVLCNSKNTDEDSEDASEGEWNGQGLEDDQSWITLCSTTDQELTSKIGRNLFPRELIKLQTRVIARNTR